MLNAAQQVAQATISGTTTVLQAPVVGTSAVISGVRGAVSMAPVGVMAFFMGAGPFALLAPAYGAYSGMVSGSEGGSTVATVLGYGLGGALSLITVPVATPFVLAYNNYRTPPAPIQQENQHDLANDAPERLRLE